MTLRDQIIDAQDMVREPVEAPEWGCTLYVTAMTGTQRDKLEADTVAGGKKMNLANFRARLLVQTLVDEEGKRVFQDGDAAALGNKSSLVLDRFFSVAMRLSGISQQDVEELEKN